jgi:hypothetical protein
LRLDRAPRQHTSALVQRWRGCAYPGAACFVDAEFFLKNPLTAPNDGAILHHMRKTHRQTMSLTAAQHSALVEEAAQLQISVSDLVRRILDEWKKERKNVQS